MRLPIAVVLMVVCTPQLCSAQQGANKPAWSDRVQTVLDVTRPLEHDRGSRLPLYLWPAMRPGELDEAAADLLVEELDRRGIGLVGFWTPARQEESLARSLVIGRAQKKAGLRINVNATGCLHRFFNGDEQTAHVDADGKPFWDESFDVRSHGRTMGCPFALESRKDPVRRQTEFFATAYKEAGLDVDFVFVDWEIDGPIEFNHAQEASRKCVRCREHLADVDDFPRFQKTLREIRSELQRYALADPIHSQFPAALVGNYAVYPHNGYRYWYDYFEYFVPGQPHVADQRAKYRLWAHEFAATGYNCAMPVAYTWYPTYQWYDFDEPDYRWFYNMLLVAGNAGRHTPPEVPIVSFVHWHTTAPPEDADPSVRQFSQESYQELLWHMLLRGTDTFFLWCRPEEDAVESRLVQEVYARAQEYGEFLERGTPISFDVPKRPAPVVSGLVLGNRVLVRRTDFGGGNQPVELTIGTRKLSVESNPGQCRVLSLE